MEWIAQCNPEVVLSGVFALLGAVIGVVGSLSTVFLTKAVQKHGKITLHARIVGSRIDAAHRTWGYIQTDQGISYPNIRQSAKQLQYRQTQKPNAAHFLRCMNLHPNLSGYRQSLPDKL